MELQVRVQRRSTEAENICSFELVPQGGTLPAFSAGSHIDVLVAPGVMRQYSLCNDPCEQDRYRIAVLREPHSRGGSVGMHEHVREGDVLRVSPPRNNFALVPARRSMLLAGGIGVTPLLAMARALHAGGSAFDMHYCGRTARSMAFLKEIQRSAFASRVQMHTDDGPPEKKFDANLALAQPAQDTHLYVCGPAGFMNHVLETARRHGWAEALLHREFFAGADAASVDRAFDVRVASSGITCQVPAGKSVIEVLRANGVEVPSSCESGVCGTCLTRVLEGTPDHRDNLLTDSERAANNKFTPCCSRALSTLLVLDL